MPRWNDKIINKISIICVLICSIFISHAAAEPPNKIIEYYNQWIGCKSPSFRFVECDRIEYLEKNPKGKRILFYGFHSGDFINEPDYAKLFSELSSLDKARSEFQGHLIVVGLTYGAMFSPCLSDGSEIPKNIERISRFPIVNLNSRRGDNVLGEPYEFLKKTPGAILIDKNGVICKIFLHPMTEKDFREAIKTEPWRGKIKQPPKKTSQEMRYKKSNKQ